MHLQLKRGLVVVPLSPTSMQIGLAPGPTYRLQHLTPAMCAFISLLTSAHTWNELVARSGLDHEVATTLARQLTRVGLLDTGQHSSRKTQDRDRVDRARLHYDLAAWSLATSLADGREIMNRRANAWVELHGTGRMSFALGRLFAAAGVGRITVAPGEIVTEHDCGPLGPLPEHSGQPSHRALTTMLDADYPSVHHVPHPHHLPDVTIIACNAAFPDLELCDALVSQDRAHLPVVARGGGFVLGPFVIPGASACVRCDELVNSDRNATNAWIATAMRTHPSPPHAFDAVLGTMVASIVTLNALAFIDQVSAPPLVNSVAATTLPTGELVMTATTPHPACGCAWSQSLDG